jgi:hypothetical protein
MLEPWPHPQLRAPVIDHRVIEESIMRSSTALAAAAFAFAIPALAASQSSSSANEHQYPPDKAHAEAKQSVIGRPIVGKENSDYANAVKACKKLPASQRTTCISEAGNSANLAAKAHGELRSNSARSGAGS